MPNELCVSFDECVMSLTRGIIKMNFFAKISVRRGGIDEGSSLHIVPFIHSDVAKPIEIQVLFYYLYSDARVVTFSCGNSIAYAKWHGVNAFS